MTLRKLINKSSYKSVFNILYQEYYKEKEDEEVSHIDLSYLGVWKELIKKDLNLNKDYKIYITEKEDGFDGGKYIDVCLYSVVEEELYAMDTTLWSEMIDMEVYKAVKMDDTKALAHILWEMTFYGFTEKTVALKKEEFKELARRIDSGEEKMIPWEDIKNDLDNE
jgi:hypothetical protein